MSIFSRLSGIFGGSATRKAVGDQIASPGIYSSPTAKPVTEDNALQVSAVWACVRLLSETIATLPIHVVESSTDGDVVVVNALSRLLSAKPNARMTSQEFRETMMLNLTLHGNAFAYIQRNVRGEPVSVWPLPAQQMRVTVLDDGSVVYEYTDTRNIDVYDESNILHIKLFGNGTVGLSPLAYARNAIGLGAASDEYSSRFFINGGKPSGILTYDKTLSTEQRKKIRENLAGMAEGTSNSHRLFVLEAGMNYSQIQLNPDDMQMIQTRRFQLEDIARFFGVPSFLINDTEKTTTWGTGIEQMMLGFYKLALKPYANRWQQAMEAKLLSPQQRGKLTIRFDFDSLLDADTKTKGEYLRGLVQGGLISPNEGRRKLGFAPHKAAAASQLFIQQNMTPVGTIGGEDEKLVSDQQ